MLQKLKDTFSAPFTVLVLQISLVAVIIVSVTLVKFLGGDIYTDLKQWYIVNFDDDTDVNEVVNPESKQPELTDKNEDTATETEQSEIDTLPTVTNTVLQSTKTDSVNSMCLPLQNGTVTSEFGGRINPITNANEKHKGLDLSSPEGSSIYAAADGEVILSQKSSSYGNYIIIDHGGGLKTLYAHCSKLLIEKGDSVKKGQVIAKVGSTGQSTRPHLHFEVILNGEYLNPSWLINW